MRVCVTQCVCVCVRLCERLCPRVRVCKWLRDCLHMHVSVKIHKSQSHGIKWFAETVALSITWNKVICRDSGTVNHME